MIYICDYCGGIFDHDPIPVSKKTACPFCKRESYSRTNLKTKSYEEMPTLRAASEKEIKFFKSDSYSPPEMLPDDEWEEGTDFIEDYEPFWDERGEDEEENLREPLYKVRFSDDYEGMASPKEEDEDPFLWVDTDSQVMAPKSRQPRKKKAS